MHITIALTERWLCQAPKATGLVSTLGEESLSSGWSPSAFLTYGQFFSVTLTPSVPVYWIIFGAVLKLPNSTLVHRWHLSLLQTFLWNVDGAGLCFPPFTSRKSAAKVVGWPTESWGSRESQRDVLKEKVQLWGLVQARGLLFPSPCSSFPQPLTLVTEVVPLSDCLSVLLEATFVRRVGVRLNSGSYCVFPKNACETSTLICPHFISWQEEQGGVVDSFIHNRQRHVTAVQSLGFCCYSVLFWRQGLM